MAAREAAGLAVGEAMGVAARMAAAVAEQEGLREEAAGRAVAAERALEQASAVGGARLSRLEDDLVEAKAATAGGLHCGHGRRVPG